MRFTVVIPGDDFDHRKALVKHFVPAVVEQRAAGEDIALDEIHAAASLFIALIANGDGLQQHEAIGLEQGGAGLEVGGKVGVPYGLDHLDRYQLVVLAFQFAVVLEQ